MRSLPVACPFLLAVALGGSVTGRASADVLVDAGRGPVLVRVPSGTSGEPAPLFVFLHGWNNDGDGVEGSFGFAPLADQHGFLYVTPDAPAGFLGIRDWDLDQGDDDSEYLAALIEAVRAALAVDERRIFVGGYSSGGGMAFRMGCDHAALLAGIVAIAGTMSDPPQCAPQVPLHVLAVHGSNDSFAWYGGGPLFGGYIGAVEAAHWWGEHSGCSLPPEELLDVYNLDGSVPGAETDVLRFQVGCAEGGSDELWSIQGGSHAPAWTAAFRDAVFAFLSTHAKPGPADPLTDFCHGSAEACPCANGGAAGHGCDNSFATGGARLIAIEAPMPDELALVGAGLPPGEPTVLAIRGLAGTRPVAHVFGDGLLCLEAPLVRLAAGTGADGSVRVTVRNAATAPGAYDYQLWYRNTAPFCTPHGFNLSNALRRVWP